MFQRRGPECAKAGSPKSCVFGSGNREEVMVFKVQAISCYCLYVTIDQSISRPKRFIFQDTLPIENNKDHWCYL